MNATRRPQGNDPEEPFIPDVSEGAETGLYLALFELFDEGLIITGDERVLEANSAACRLLERDYRQVAGRPLAELFPSERDFLDARARLFIRGETRGTLRVSLPGGRLRELRFAAAARIRPGIHALILSPERNVELVADTPPADTLWPRLAAALEQPVIVVDDKGRVAAANAAALAALKLARKEIVGHAVDARLDITWPARGAAQMARLKVRGGADTIAARLLPGPKPDWQLLLLPFASARSASPAPPTNDSTLDVTPPRADAGTPVTPHGTFQARLREAIGLDQLEVHFQPLVDACDGSVRGGEALMRWRHPDPEVGLLPFRRFIGLARDAGLLDKIGDWVLHAACAEAARWPANADRLLRVTVNVAHEQILRGDLVERVRHALDASGLPAARLELDIDEQVFNEEDDHILATLEAIHETGVKIALDDFGRGLASIPRLKRYPLAALKLDPALVRDVGKHEDSEAIVEAISSMAAVLGLDVLARGVESAAQQAFLSVLGCRLQQGPLFGQPMSAAEFRAFLTPSDAVPGQ